jgi:trk system potassium uptake protein TrkH
MLPLRIGRRPMPDSLPAAVLGFTFLYFISVVTLTFALLWSGLDFITAFSAIIACINNMGPGLGTVGPSTNYASLTDFQSWVCALAMIAVRSPQTSQRSAGESKPPGHALTACQ